VIGCAALDFGEAELDSTVPVRFRHVLDSLSPDMEAYVGSDERTSYGELAARSRRLACFLAGIIGTAASRPEQRAVAVFLPQGAASLVGILAVMKTGHFYVPLDAVMGEAMMRDILLECSPEAIVTNSALLDSLRALLPAGLNPPALCLDALPSGPAPCAMALPLDGRLIASVQYTSGSTGRPRGVMRLQSSNLHASYLARYDLDFAPGARIAHLRSYAYGASQQPVFGGLLNGSTLYSMPLQDSAPSDLYRWIVEREITHLYVTLGTLRSLADLGDAQSRLSSLKVIMTGGEPLYRADVERLYRILSPDCRFVSRLVSTETSIYARYSFMRDTVWTGATIPGGFAAPGCRVSIVDERRKPLPRGEVGEIAVRSRFLAAGYWKRPEELSIRFLPDPEKGEERIFLTGDLGRMNAEGCIEMLGRKDSMVKIRGYRVELPAIEAVLQTEPGVSDCVVVALPDRDGESRLVAYVVPGRQSELSVSCLRKGLGLKLPQYMVPSRFVFIDHLARRENSKVDHSALPPPGSRRPDLDTRFVAARTDLEGQIADIWAELLKLDAVGVDDDFFELGGDSITAMRMQVQVEKQLGQELASAFSRSPTVAGMAGTTAEVETSAAGAVHCSASGSTKPPNHRRPWRARIEARLRHYIAQGPIRGNTVLLPYGAGVLLQRILVAMPSIQRLFSRHVGELELWQEELGEEPAGRQSRLVSLMANTFIWWRQRALAHPDALERWLDLSGAGMDVLNRPSLHGGMVLVLPHVGRLIIPLEMMVSLRGRESSHVTNDESIHKTGDIALWAMRQTESRANQLWRARKVLERGGAVLIAGDGLQGRHAVGVRFHGRLRPFQTGAAVLAVETGSLFVPAFPLFDTSGRVHIEILSPLTTDAATEEERISDLTRQYGLLYAERWPSFCFSINWSHLRYNRGLPRKEAGGGEPA
jgi:amino acid adenylation domain-containing protein